MSRDRQAGAYMHNEPLQPYLVCATSVSESALFAKCAQTHKEFVVVFKKLLVHACIHTYISDMRTEIFKLNLKKIIIIM